MPIGRKRESHDAMSEQYSDEPHPASRSTASEGGKRTPFERIALLLQGGGALGSYQAGVYQALAEADLHPDWVAGISIGAINSAIIAGNAPDKRVDRLRDFWETVSNSPLGIPYFKSFELKDEFNHQVVNQARAMCVLMFGAPNFFVPRMPPATLWPGGSADKGELLRQHPITGPRSNGWSISTVSTAVKPASASGRSTYAAETSFISTRRPTRFAPSMS
jgi:hypothetical protein